MTPPLPLVSEKFNWCAVIGKPVRPVPTAAPVVGLKVLRRSAAAFVMRPLSGSSTAKYGLLGDAPFFDWLEANREAVFAGGAARVEAIAVSCRAKAGIVARDEFETSERMLLNLGHTFGHALEAITGYDGSRLVHGEAVSIGMVLAHDFSVRMNLCSPDDAARARAHLEAIGLPVSPRQVPGGVGTADDLMAAIFQDKKVKRGRLTFILARGIGESFIAPDIDVADVREFLTSQLD